MANGKPSMLVRILVVIVALVVGLGAGLVVVGLAGGDGGATTEPAPVAEPEQQAEPSTQVFEGSVASAEYRGTLDSTGNAIVSFMVTNNSDQAVSAYFENVVVNGQFNVQVMGGTEVPIDPGNMGAAQMVFGVPTQTTLSGVDELETLEADLVLYTDSPVEPVDTIHVSVTL